MRQVFSRPRSIAVTLLLISLSTTLSAGLAQAQTQGWQSNITAPNMPKPKAAPASPRPPVQAQAQPSTPQQPLQAQMQFLVRTTLLALHDANRTGNYTVLRDLSAPSFRDRSSAADLAQVFAELRRAKLDLSMAAILTPDFDEAPALDANRRMSIKGSFATEPNRVVFDILYEAVAGQWQLFGLSISTRPSRTASR